jgi:THO complex subunit 3
METRSASLFLGAHSDEVDYVAWNPTHPELFCSSSQKDRRIVFWDARRISRALSVCASQFVICTCFFLCPESQHVQQLTVKVPPVQINYAPDGESLLYVSSGNQLFFMSYGKDSDDSAAQAQ